MRNMSFALTTPQILARTKTVTRRLGWCDLKPGDLVQAVVKGMGLKKGQKVRRLAVIRIVSVREEPLADITPEDVIAEGFPEMTPREFTEMFMRTHPPCSRWQFVNRIAFEYVDSTAEAVSLPLGVS